MSLHLSYPAFMFVCMWLQLSSTVASPFTSHLVMPSFFSLLCVCGCVHCPVAVSSAWLACRCLLIVTCDSGRLMPSRTMMGGGTHNRPKTPAEMLLELESRDVYSAVALGWEHGGGLDGHECYRCLTTTSKLWHEYGKLKLPMCNGCVVQMDRHVCGW